MPRENNDMPRKVTTCLGRRVTTTVPVGASITHIRREILCTPHTNLKLLGVQQICRDGIQGLGALDDLRGGKRESQVGDRQESRVEQVGDDWNMT